MNTPFSFRIVSFRTALFSFACVAFISSTFADSASEMAEMQKRLNQETQEKPFQVADAAKIDSYIADAMKRNLQPKQTPPDNWQPGYTCDSYYNQYGYNYNGYRDCMYYQHYYGRYW